MRDTSLEAFMKIKPELNNKEKEVYNLLCKNEGGLTNPEISELLQWPINSVTGRITSLVDKGLVESVGKKINENTGMNNTVWDIVCVCPKCGCEQITDCPGSTNIKPIPEIKFICTRCLHEW